jgi:phosphatidylglycerol:prolipoprotein diacylglycerol transferase
MLMYYVHDLSPFLLQFSNGIGIRYYGLAYVLGFIWLYWALGLFERRGWLHWGQGTRDEFLFWVALAGVVAGGRIGYMLLYDWTRFATDPLSLFRIWEGGMASHGGIIGVAIVTWLYARRRKVSFAALADAVAWAAPLALALGRVANFINGELWGRPSTVPWAVIFPQAPLIDGQIAPRHPSQLYEALFEGLAVFVILWIARFKAKKLDPGTLSILFLLLYSMARIGCEYFREPDGGRFLWWGITMGQALTAGLLLVLLVWVFFWKLKSAPPKTANPAK